jgi:hypothetical protein
MPIITPPPSDQLLTIRWIKHKFPVSQHADILQMCQNMSFMDSYRRKSSLFEEEYALWKQIQTYLINEHIICKTEDILQKIREQEQKQRVSPIQNRKHQADQDELVIVHMQLQPIQNRMQKRKHQADEDEFVKVHKQRQQRLVDIQKEKFALKNHIQELEERRKLNELHKTNGCTYREGNVQSEDYELTCLCPDE